MQTLKIYRVIVTPTSENLMEVAEIKPSDNSVQVKMVMGENVLNISFDDNRYIDFKINDYCTVFGERYQINQVPPVTKKSRYLYSYSLQLQAEMYDMAKAHYLFLGPDNTLRESEFSLMGTAEDFINLIIQNMGRVGAGWTKGQVIPSGYKNLTFSRENCHEALSRIAEAFETEYSVEGKTIHLTKRSSDTGHTYRHGRNKGLYEIVRQPLNNSNVVTRLYAFGSEKNLPGNYATNGKRLRFPGGYNPCLISNLECVLVDNGNGTQTFTFTWTDPLSQGVAKIEVEYRIAGSISQWQEYDLQGLTPQPREVTLPNGDYEFRFRTYGSTCYNTIPGGGIATPAVEITGSTTAPLFVFTPLPYIERNIDKYGVVEHVEYFDDIFPHRTGKVTSVNASDPFEFSDSAIDFNVNDYLLAGLTAKVTFNTGQLAGYTFEVASFNNGDKKFRINRNGDDRILEIPSTSLKPAIGDEYVLIDIQMPTSYVTAAEQELLVAANARLVELSDPQVSYTITLDPAFIKRIGRTININDLVWIVDAELSLQKKIRVVSTTRNIVNEYQYQAEISDIISPGTIQRIISASETNGRDIAGINAQLLNNSILNNNVVGTLIFQNMPETSNMTGFLQVVIEVATGKIYKKV